MRRRRGNLLLMAIFMAVFLFFLSVALVATNRQDLVLSISVDHRLRAQMAARSAMNYAIQTMRSDSQWESTLQNKTGELQDGATWTAKAAPVTTFTSQPNLVEIRGKGVSGFMASESRMVAEEFRICETLARQNLKPHLLAISNTTGSNVMMMMGPSFTWSALTTLGERMILGTFTGGGGPFYMAMKSSEEAQVLEDWRPTVGANNMYQPNWGATNFSVPPTQLMNTLDLENRVLRWRILIDQNGVLGSVKQATGSPNMVSIQVGSTVVQVDTGKYEGAKLHAYIIDGQKMSAEGTTLYCHAQHYYFKGSSFQNKPVVEGETLVNRGDMTPAIFENDNAVLKYADGTWTIVNDCLIVAPDGSNVTHADGPRPEKSSLAVSQGNIFAISPQPGALLLRAKTSRWEEDGRNDSKSNFLIAYRGQASVQVPATPTEPPAWSGIPRPKDSFPAVIPEIRGDYFDSRAQQFKPKIVVPQQTIDLRPTMFPGGTCVVGDEIFTSGYLQSTFSPLATQADLFPCPTFPGNIKTFVLMHFDGKTWQIWPGGLFKQTWDPYAPRSANSILVHERNGNLRELSLFPFAVCGYSAQPALMRRYAPLTVGP